MPGYVGLGCGKIWDPLAIRILFAGMEGDAQYNEVKVSGCLGM